MAVYDALNSGNTVGRWLGYTTGRFGGAGIHAEWAWRGRGDGKRREALHGGNTLSVTEGGAVTNCRMAVGGDPGRE